jgi:hypothetical protein
MPFATPCHREMRAGRSVIQPIPRSRMIASHPRRTRASGRTESTAFLEPDFEQNGRSLANSSERTTPRAYIAVRRRRRALQLLRRRVVGRHRILLFVCGWMRFSGANSTRVPRRRAGGGTENLCYGRGAGSDSTALGQLTLRPLWRLRDSMNPSRSARSTRTRLSVGLSGSSQTIWVPGRSMYRTSQASSLSSTRESWSMVTSPPGV